MMMGEENRGTELEVKIELKLYKPFTHLWGIDDATGQNSVRNEPDIDGWLYVWLQQA
jgi:hypothetical protein